MPSLTSLEHATQTDNDRPVVYGGKKKERYPYTIFVYLCFSGYLSVNYGGRNTCRAFMGRR